MVALGDFIEFCMSMLNDATVPKITVNFWRISGTLTVGPMYLAISTAAPFSNCTILSLTTDSG